MDKQIQLFLLPYAGGSSFSFMKMLRHLDSRIESVTIEYPGRGGRKNEAIINDYNSFLYDVVSQIKSRRKEDLYFSILGYSMGSALAFDICSENLIEENIYHAFFCAEGSLLADNLARKYASLSDEDFKKSIYQLGGLDNRLLEDEESLNAYLHLIKCDHEVLGQYVYRGNMADCNSSIIYSSEDPTCIDMDDWEKIISGNVNYYEVGNNHFFLNQEYKKLASIINAVLFHEKVVLT